VPFEHACPRSLTAGSIRTNAPTGSGLYGISNAREWIFIGETNNIQAKLLDHLQNPETPLMKMRPTGFVFESCEPAGRPARHNRLVLEYEPACNRKG
jgi:hypothetical protein